jgi:ZIP family zinc transporter
MIPEAFERTHLYTGLIATIGFIVSFGVERL